MQKHQTYIPENNTEMSNYAHCTFSVTAALVFAEIFLVQNGVSMTDTVHVYSPAEDMLTGDSI